MEPWSKEWREEAGKEGLGGGGADGACLRCRGKLTLMHPDDICFSSQLNNNDHHIQINKSSIIVFQYILRLLAKLSNIILGFLKWRSGYIWSEHAWT